MQQGTPRDRGRCRRASSGPQLAGACRWRLIGGLAAACLLDQAAAAGRGAAAAPPLRLRRGVLPQAGPSARLPPQSYGAAGTAVEPRRRAALLLRHVQQLKRWRAGEGPGDAALERELPLIDKKAAVPEEVAQADTWPDEQCPELARRIIKDYARRGSAHKAAGQQVIHTGIYLAGWKSAELPRVMEKVQLSVLSFLASQDLKRTRLRIWSDWDPANPANPLVKALAAILARPDLAASITLSRFDPATEFAKAGTNTGKLISKFYALSPKYAQKSDLQRVAILYNYGGLWMDVDMIYIQDMGPLMGEDWAYLGQPGLINNAALSVSEPGSLFATAYLSALVNQDLDHIPDVSMLKEHDNYFHYGADTLYLLFHGPWEHDTFHVLPTCFLDPTWVAVTNSTPWDEFFTEPATGMGDRLSFLYPQNQGQETFAYHWHGRWTSAVSNSSLAHALLRIYICRLNLEKCEY